MRVVLQEETHLQIRIDGEESLPTLIYLPGLHGDWTLLPGFRELARERFRLAQFIYPRSLTWSLKDYARAVDDELKKAGVTGGWILAESFGSQVAWAWLQLSQKRLVEFRFEGIILAGGFVRFPIRFSLGCAKGLFSVAPQWIWRSLFLGYVAYSGFRHRNAPSAGHCAKEFVDRRTPLDIEAMRARLKLIAEADLREVARKAKYPVYLLAGKVDPVVPPWLVRRWLRKNCLSFRGDRIIWPADHNVLGTEPAKALRQIDRWIYGDVGSSACLSRNDRGT